MRRDHPFVTSGGTDYSLLENETFIMTEDSPNLGLRQFAQGTANEVGLTLRHQVSSKQFETIVMQIEAGMGVSILPAWVNNYELYNSENVEFIPLKEKCLDFGVIWNKDSKNAVLPLFPDLLDKEIHAESGAAPEGKPSAGN